MIDVMPGVCQPNGHIFSETARPAAFGRRFTDDRNLQYHCIFSSASKESAKPPPEPSTERRDLLPEAQVHYGRDIIPSNPKQFCLTPSAFTYLSCEPAGVKLLRVLLEMRY